MANNNYPLKAYWVEANGEEWGMYLHAKSVSDAKRAYLTSNPACDDPAWIDLRVRRPKRSELLDGAAFTNENLRNAGYDLVDCYGEACIEESFLEFCHCAICNAEKAKSRRVEAMV